MLRNSCKDLIRSNKSVRVLIYSVVAIIVLVFLTDALLSAGLNYEKNPSLILLGIVILFIPLFMGYKVRHSSWSTVIVYSLLLVILSLVTDDLTWFIFKGNITSLSESAIPMVAAFVILAVIGKLVGEKLLWYLK